MEFGTFTMSGSRLIYEILPFTAIFIVQLSYLKSEHILPLMIKIDQELKLDYSDKENNQFATLYLL